MFSIAIFAMFVGVGMIPVWTQLSEGGTWGAEPSLGLLTMAGGLLGIAYELWSLRKRALERAAARTAIVAD